MVSWFSTWNYTYCGDGPEPVEPVQLCLGWCDWRGGGTTKIVKDYADGHYRWADCFGFRYSDQGKFSHASPVGVDHEVDIVRRRPDLDAKEAAEKQPDPRDAEIERLKAEANDRRTMLELALAEVKALVARVEKLERSPSGCCFGPNH